MSEHREIRGEEKEVHSLGTDPEGNELLLVLDGDSVSRVHRITPDGEDRAHNSPHTGGQQTPQSISEQIDAAVEKRLSQIAAENAAAAEKVGEGE